MKIVWNNNALESLDKNIEYLKKKWSVNDVEKFLEIIDKKIEILKSFPEIGTLCEFKPLLRQPVITKHITLFYEVEIDVIYLPLFWLNYNDKADLQMFLS
ncbi:MAG: type II toxin-antitoxin system RelE/ParE family toxin [Polaribacter sp.]